MCLPATARREARVLAETRSGGACVNDVVSHMIGTGLPFGGLGESGMGAYHGRAGFDEFSHQRAVLRRATWLDHAISLSAGAAFAEKSETGDALSFGRLTCSNCRFCLTIEHVASCHHHRSRPGRVGLGHVAGEGRGGSHRFGKAAARGRAHFGRSRAMAIVSISARRFFCIRKSCRKFFNPSGATCSRKCR